MSEDAHSLNPLLHTIRLRRSDYSLNPLQLDTLASEFEGRVVEGAMAGDGRDEEDEVTIEFQSAPHKLECESALRCFKIRR